MYGLPQAGILTNELVQRRLALDGYRPTEHTHGLWKHKTLPVWFSLIVDDFGIKYIGLNNTEHLMASIKKNYDISSDCTGSAYCGLNIDCDYINGTVDLSMPGYTNAALQKYQHPGLPSFITKICDSLTTAWRYTSISCSRSGTHVNHAGQCFGFITSKIHSCYSRQTYQITQLLYHAPRSHFTLPCIRHDIKYTQ
jgi:hypothetical protein